MTSGRIASTLLAIFLLVPVASAQSSGFDNSALQSSGYADSALQSKIASKLSQDAALQDDRLTVAVSDGVATVSGTVDSLWETWKARDDVASVFGIVGYEPRLTIEDAGVPDSSLQNAVEDALRRNLLDNPQVGTIEASVQGGVVTFTGTVRDARKRYDARDAAAKQRGVKQVVDQLQSPASTDDLIQQSVASILAGGTGTPISGDIRTTVEDGVVTLSGTTMLLSGIYGAEERVMGINGVTGVVMQLTVQPPSREVKTLRP